MQQAIDILDEMMEERTPYKEDMPLHKTLWYEVFHWWYIALEEAKSRIQALPDGWISTAIQLPPEDTNVLIFEWWQSNLSWWNEPKIWWYNKKFWFQSFTDYLIATHWMLLPLPPK